MVSTLQTAILGHNPECYWVCDDAPSSAVLRNSGSLGTALNLNKVSLPLPGAYSLKADGTETSVFQSATTANQGWNLANPASMAIGAATPFTFYCVLQAFSPNNSRNAWVNTVGKSGTFGGVNLGVSSGGFAVWDLSTISGLDDTTIIPPIIADGLVHDLALVRDVAHNQLQAYLDGRLILFKTDPTSGLAISDNTKFINVGNWGAANQDFIGLYSDVVQTKTVWSPFDIAALHVGLWAGNPPQVGSSVGASTLEALALQSAELSAMAANLTSVLAAVRRTFPTT